MSELMDLQVDELLRGLDGPSRPDDAFVNHSLAQLLPAARRARRRDRSPVGRFWRDIVAWAHGLRMAGAPLRRPLVAAALVLVALLLAALLVVLVGTKRHVPPPFGLAGNGEIAYVANGEVVLAGPDGSSPRQITGAGGSAADPTFSRDGTRLAWREFHPGGDPETADAIIADADGANPVVIAHAVKGLSHLAWSPDGRDVAFSGSIDRSPGAGWIARADGSSPPVAFTTVAGAWDPTWSPDGQRLVIGADPGILYVVDRDGSSLRRLTHEPFKEVGSRGEVAEWTPAGDLIAFTAFHEDEVQHVYLIGLDGSPEREVSDPGVRSRDASFSPDGTELAFMRAGSGYGPFVEVLDLRTMRSHVLSGAYGWYQPIWSPDGTRIVITDDRPGANNVEGPAVRVILDVGGRQPPVVLSAPGLTPELVPDWPASWQRIAP